MVDDDDALAQVVQKLPALQVHPGKGERIVAQQDMADVAGDAPCQKDSGKEHNAKESEDMLDDLCLVHLNVLCGGAGHDKADDLAILIPYGMEGPFLHIGIPQVCGDVLAFSRQCIHFVAADKVFPDMAGIRVVEADAVRVCNHEVIDADTAAFHDAVQPFAKSRRKGPGFQPLDDLLVICQDVDCAGQRLLQGVFHLAQFPWQDQQDK